MSNYKVISLSILFSLFLSACGPGQLFGPTLTPTPSPTPTVTPTLTPTATPTATNTPLPTATLLYPLPGLGITDQKLVSFAESLDYIASDTTVDGLPARKYVSPEGYTVLTLVGKPPYLEKVILEIDIDRENLAMATATRIYILEVASNYAGRPAADWVRENLQKAIQSGGGRAEKVFKNTNIILEVEGSIFRLTFEPAVK